ncbi:GNAT family N-acetyltransferase [Streptococcus moroccensis]|nr:GNAT family N-acetyltransferase [Streptococcus moroccensis]
MAAIRPVCNHDMSIWAELAAKVWQTSSSKLIERFQSGAFPYEFLYWENGRAVAFISLSIRQDYVEGATQKPVAYLEGIGVLEVSQRRGIAGELADFARIWAKDQGLTQLASNCDLSNTISQNVHQALGFQEVSRTVNYILDC